MSAAHSFPPIAGPGAKLLILGSMPGQASLAAGQYYAHPRNAFWPIMGRLFAFALDLPYAERVAALEQAGVAVWDVLQSCWRPGSLDADIAPDSMVANDFSAFFRAQPGIQRIYFNGATAERCYRQHVAADISGSATLHRLPSTSPAHASLSFDQKVAAWQQLRERRA